MTENQVLASKLNEILFDFIQDKGTTHFNVKFSGSRDLNGNQVVLVELNDQLKIEEFYLMLQIASNLNKISRNGAVEQQTPMKLTLIVDCEKVSANHGMNIGDYISHIKILNAQFPHSVHVCLFVNVNWIIKGFFSLLPSTNSVNFNRIKFINYFDDIAEFISPESTPIQYGGNHHLPFDCDQDYHDYIVRQLLQVESVKEMVRLRNEEDLSLNEIHESPPSSENLVSLNTSNNSYQVLESEDEYLDCKDDATLPMFSNQYDTVTTKKRVSFSVSDVILDSNVSNNKNIGLIRRIARRSWLFILALYRYIKQKIQISSLQTKVLSALIMLAIFKRLIYA